MDVVLKQLVGTRGAGSGVEEVSQAVDIVLHDGLQVGWLARHTGATLIFLPKVNPALHADIRNQADELRRKEGLYMPIHDSTVQAPDVPQEVIDELTDEEDDD